jgi:hypothetical protein
VIKIQFKKLTKKFFILIIRCLPRELFDKYVYLFASLPRSNGKIGFYKERLVNYLNREIIIDELKKRGGGLDKLEVIIKMIFLNIFLKTRLFNH